MTKEKNCPRMTINERAGNDREGGDENDIFIKEPEDDKRRKAPGNDIKKERQKPSFFCL